MPHMVLRKYFGRNYGYHGNFDLNLFHITCKKKKTIYVSAKVKNESTAQKLWHSHPRSPLQQHLSLRDEATSQEAVSDQSPTLNISDVYISIIIIASQCPNNS